LKIKTFEKGKSLRELLKNEKFSTNIAKGEDESRPKNIGKAERMIWV
jgi:hypothetical protein